MRHTYWMWGIIIIGFVLFSFAPAAYEINRAESLQPDRQFELVHNFPTDYNFYLSRIRQGLEGRWTVIERYTSEPHNGSFVHELYLLLGQVGRIFGMNEKQAGDVYHIARIVFAIVLLVMTAQFCIRSFPKNSIIAFLLVVTASSWPKWVVVEGVPRFGGYMAWWSVVDSLQRITFIPHLLLGQALMIYLVLFFQKRNVIFLGLAGFVLGMVFPPGLIFVYGVLGILTLFQKKYSIPLVQFVCLSAPSIVYLFLMTSFYPWKRLAEFDIIHPLPFDYVEYFKAIGPIGPIGLIGLIWALLKKEKGMYLAIAWVVAWMFLLWVFQFIPSQSPLRFSEMIPNLGLGVLAGYLFYKIRALGKLLCIFLIILGLFHMYSSFLWQTDFVDHKMRATVPLVPSGSYVMYPLKDFIAAIEYIHDHAKRDAIVLSETTAGNYIPAYGGTTVYVGHDNTVHAEAKKLEVHEFFAGNMSVQMAKEFVKKTGASYIFFGPQEKEAGGVGNLSKIYPFVTEVYHNGYITVYEL